MNITKEIVHATRSLGKSKTFALTVIVTIALGIGANGAIFSVVKGVLFNRLPYGNSDELVFIWNQFPGAGDLQIRISEGELADWKSHPEVFSDVATIATGEQNIVWTLSDNGQTETYQGAFISSNFLNVVEASPFLGRGFMDQEGVVGSNRVVLLSEAFWANRLGAARDVLGRSLIINGEPREVVGVMPADFNTDLNVPNTAHADFWLPLVPERGFPRNGRWMNAVARLAPGVTVGAASTAASEIAAQFAADYPEAYQDENYGVAIDPLEQRVVVEVRAPLKVLMATVGVVLLIACFNVVNLFIIRAESRVRETAVRIALGSGRVCVIRQFATEALLLAGAGGLLGLTVAYGSIGLLRSLNPGGIPRIDFVTVDGTVLAFLAGLTLLAGLTVGLVPGIHAVRTDVNAMLRDGGRGSTSGAGRHRTRQALVSLEVALAVVLVVGAGLLVRSFRSLLSTDLGIDADNVVTMRFDLPDWQYPDIEQVLGRHESVLEAVAALPNVQSVAVAHAEHPLRLNGRWFFDIAGREAIPGEAVPMLGIRVVSPDYLETLRISLVDGRGFTEFDRAGSGNHILINEEMARTWFPGEDPIGKRITIARAMPNPPELEIVGVIGNVRNEGITSPVRPAILLPLANPTFASGWRRHMTLHVLASGDPAEVLRLVRSTVADVDPNLPVTKIRPLDSVISNAVAVPRFLTALLGSFATLALVLAAIGIYGVISYTVAERTQEIGVRMALGASGAKILALVMRQGVALALTGVLLGTAGAALLTRLLSAVLYGVRPTDPVTFAAVSAGLLAVALAASYLPARRAAAIEPGACLRDD